MSDSKRMPRILGIDAGGTMTDTFLIDADGNFVVGKAQTTPDDESVGFMRSLEDGLKYWDVLHARLGHRATAPEGRSRQRRLRCGREAIACIPRCHRHAGEV